jgi:hypothetical protein
MKNKIKEIKNFLSKEDFTKLYNLVTDLDFPWRIRNRMTQNDTNCYFTYCFYNDFQHTSDYYFNYIMPILKKLNCKAPIQIRSNMVINKLFEKSGWHTDYPYNSTTAILYLNTCNGGTELKINNEIKFINAEENKIVIFPSNTEHRACTSTDSNKRYIINFNYF